MRTGRKNGLYLEATGITKIFPGVVALNEVDFACKKGTVHCIVGENGAVKVLCKSFNWYLSS